MHCLKSFFWLCAVLFEQLKNVWPHVLEYRRKSLNLISTNPNSIYKIGQCVDNDTLSLKLEQDVQHQDQLQTAKTNDEGLRSRSSSSRR